MSECQTAAEPVIYEQRDGIVTLTLNRPDQRNPISDSDMIEALLAAIARLDADEAARVAILTGAGAAFCSGGNVKKMGMAGGVNDPLPARTRRNYRTGIQRLPAAFAAMEIPVIAAVNGPAIGAGCDLACMCDLRIAGSSARFVEAFVKLGLIAGDGGAWLLPRTIGFAKAAEMALTGDPVGAEDALAIGLVSRVVPDADLMDEARKLAMRIACNPPFAVRMTKRLLWQSREASLDHSLEMAAAMQALGHATRDHVEAIDALQQKRAPLFTGS
ncbi:MULTISPECIES: crotonase/enoyl-CoA hydratase family protein [unclassified Sphingomonas]|uniref:crotonase/enoyl-CoA hydratase family protein n=1 Tax=unclassified Sphingomonas TaxID=196159 RepID=UPI0006F39B98|nr:MULTISPECIES: crotonase/enoyl-CoA hydratase family protein [unclassified Sphingomonas]KQX18594.1 enoyl-CoA hydratase [Sphingomonas sp. Root1294]KQY72082.1 enoyl-CoA hydratase [Sphingomonas sp. Root50]KRB94648.1 enoyl-CoA hydratase [Sphingomonas sp. Root720]